ncbi:MAG: hypothetical protein ACFCU6_11255, partial [Balneolaceae bacterium]
MNINEYKSGGNMRLSDLLFDLIGISKDVPLDENEMAHQLKVTFQPPLEHTERLDNFVAKLKRSLVDIGTEIIPFEKSLTVGTKKRVKEGIVIVQQGTGRDDQLAINLVSSLHGNTVVGLFDEPAPIPSNPTLQQTLDSIAGAMAWNLIHVPIFVEENSWTICTMNGAVIKCGDWNNQKNDVLKSLIPKLSAQVVPPKRDEIVYREKQFDPVKQGYETFIKDFMNSAKIWQDNGLMLAHTSIDDLKHRNRYFKRIVSIYLDNRTGMSYGFMVKQLPADPAPAIEFETAPQLLKKAARKNVTLIQHNGKNYAKADLFGKEWLVHIPNIWVLSTRSGCNKTNLDPEKDILKLGLHNGEITIETPKNISAENCRPSFDTYAILAHCTGNVIIAGVLKKLYPDAIFPRVLRQNGLSLSHWHGYPDKEYPLPGYI